MTSAMSKSEKTNGPSQAEENIEDSLLSTQDFVASLHQLGEAYYHDKHPFHRRMYQGSLTREEIQGWVANRFYYQSRIPIKDAIILSKSEDREVRRNWVQRVLDHDGSAGERGGIELWLDLAESVGLDREETGNFKRLTTDAKAAVDSYVTFVETKPLFDCVAVSLTELFAADIHQSRIDTWPKNYSWIPSAGYQYFKSRLPLARRDVEWGLDYVVRHALTPQLQKNARDALIFKLGLLWDLATAIEEEYSSGVTDWRPRLASKAQLKWDKIDEVTILLLPERGLKLNPSAAGILKHCEGDLTRGEIIAALTGEFPEGDPVEIKISTMIFLDDFQEKGILQPVTVE